MDAHALLTKQGWRGTGNSLHPTNNAIGLAKPLLVGRKNDKVGLGKKVHQTSDMWWMQAFDESLKALDPKREGNSIVTSSKPGGLEAIKRGTGKWILANGGLYANFIKGAGLAGTMLQVTNENSSIKSGNKSFDETVTFKTRNAHKFSLKEQTDVKEIPKSDVSRLRDPAKYIETKEQRKARKLAKRNLRKKSSLMSMSAPRVEENIRTEKLVADEKKRKKKHKVEKSLVESSSEQSLETVQKKKRRRIK